MRSRVTILAACLLLIGISRGRAEEVASSEAQAAGAASKAEATEKTASGLEITTLREGAGSHPQASDTVVVHYEGKLQNGKVFDSSLKRGKPATFPLNRVIRCWTEGVQKMKVGGKARLLCPPRIAYGVRGAPPRIPPNATLVFEVELLEIK